MSKASLVNLDLDEDNGKLSAEVSRTDPQGLYLLSGIMLLVILFTPKPWYIDIVLLAPALLLIYLFQGIRQFIEVRDGKLLVRNVAKLNTWQRQFPLRDVDKIEYQTPADVFLSIMHGGITFRYLKKGKMKKYILGVGLSEEDGGKLASALVTVRNTLAT